MDKLNNAPLQEVSAQLKWHLNEEDYVKYSFLPGDYFNRISDNFERREGLIPDGLPFQLLVNNPTHKFFSEKKDFPFIVIGPGVSSINVDKTNYEWEQFMTQISYAFKPIFELVPKLSEFDHIHLSLDYINFFEIDFEEINIFDFLDKSLHTTINQQFIEGVKGHNIDLNFSYKDDDIGNVRFSYNKGTVKGNRSGLIVRTAAISGVYETDFAQTMTWFESAHSKCSKIFKKMTKGELYESFK